MPRAIGSWLHVSLQACAQDAQHAAILLQMRATLKCSSNLCQQPTSVCAAQSRPTAAIGQQQLQGLQTTGDGKFAA